MHSRIYFLQIYYLSNTYACASQKVQLCVCEKFRFSSLYLFPCTCSFETRTLVCSVCRLFILFLLFLVSVCIGLFVYYILLLENAFFHIYEFIPAKVVCHVRNTFPPVADSFWKHCDKQNCLKRNFSFCNNDINF